MFGQNKKKKKDLKIGNKKTSLWDKMKKVKPNYKKQGSYKNYLLQGGEKTFEQWSNGER